MKEVRRCQPVRARANELAEAEVVYGPVQNDLCCDIKMELHEEAPLAF
jgi:hypothetical protein